MDKSGNKDSSQAKDSGQKFRGEVVYIFSFDLAYDMKRGQLRQLLGQPLKEYTVEPDKRSPKQLFFYRPQTVRLPVEKQVVAGRQVEVKRAVKLFDVGAVSIQVRIPFEVQAIEDLVDFHSIKVDGRDLEEEVVALAANVLTELKPYCIKPVKDLGKSENYTVFCISSIPQKKEFAEESAEQWLMENRNRIAALLAQEENASNLSKQEAEESTELYLTYYTSDLVVIDWDAALVVGELDSLDDVLHIMEIANVQLTELAAYDRILDGALDIAYRDLARKRTFVKSEVHRNLRELRVDMARVSDEFLNITKFFGDWHFARVYQYLSKRFHLADWYRVVQDKLKTLGDLYQLIQQDTFNFWMVVLEITIVLLFIVDLVLLIAGRG